MQPLVTVNILSYNRKDDLRNTLQKVYEQDYKNIEVIVVDNNSRDGSVEMVKSEFPAVRLLELQKNIGIAGWNEGAKIANGEYLLFLDDDSYPEREAIRIGISTIASHSRCAVLAFNIYNEALRSSELTHENIFDYPSFIGCGVVMRRDVFFAVGMFNCDLFLYQHEIEFSMRVLDSGYSVDYEPKALVQHQYAATHRLYYNTMDLRKQYYKNRNTIFILMYHFSFRKIFLRLVRILLGRIVFGIVQSCFWSICRGLLAGVWLSMKNWNQRDILSQDVQKRYAFGKYAGGFFHGGEYGLKRPHWMVRREVE
jgi:GT2 family glycosyltransferase